MSDERITFDSDGIKLSGVLHSPPGAAPFPGVVVCHPHPLYGGNMNNNVVMAICHGLITRGIAALRFDFRGAGASEGEHGGGVAEQEDALAALQALQRQANVDQAHTGLAGYSFGASMALGAAPRGPDLKALAVVAPPTPGLNNPEVLVYPQPKLILAGDLDSFVQIDQVAALVERMKQPAELVLLEGADQFMVGHEEEIARHVGEFFSKHLSA